MILFRLCFSIKGKLNAYPYTNQRKPKDKSLDQFCSFIYFIFFKTKFKYFFIIDFRFLQIYSPVIIFKNKMDAIL